MISFKIPTNSTICKLKFAKTKDFEQKVRNLISEYGEGNVAVCLYMKEPAVRIFDGCGYCFLYPDTEDDIAEEIIEKISEYAAREEIGLRFIGVDCKKLSVLCARFLYCDIRAENECGGTYSVRVRSEADLLSSVPTVRESGVVLSRLRKSDITEYARICRDESALELWGYDYRADAPSCPDEYFYNTQLDEFCRGVSLTFGVRRAGKLIGEASFYAFDFKGGAQISFRLLPEYRGKGFGRATVEALLATAERISLSAIYATVNNENIPSLNLLSQYMDKVSEEGELTHFVLKGEDA